MARLIVYELCIIVDQLDDSYTWALGSLVRVICRPILLAPGALHEHDTTPVHTVAQVRMF